MARRSDASLVALLLVARAVESSVPPLKASEFWALVDKTADLGSLFGAPDGTVNGRIAALLDRANALAFELERLESAGIVTLSPFDDGYPSRWRQRLGRAAPPMLHAAGPVSLLERGGLAVVGSRDVHGAAREAAAAAADAAARAGRVVISGGARGSDLVAMQAALAAGGEVVGVLADALLKTANDREVRRAIGDERLCLVTPYAPTAPFSVGNAMGRNKLIYALADVTFVVASDDGKGGTWAGATEALKKGYGTVAAWVGADCGPGNPKLVELGAQPVAEIGSSLLAETEDTASSRQLRLGL